MTPEELHLVQTSYAALGDGAHAMAIDFYGRLFAADPSAEPLFEDGPEIMAVKFTAELDAIVQAISDFDEFEPRVADLAARHVGYGVQTHHYRSVGDALIGALADHLSPDWDATLEAAWRRAYNLVAEVMMASAADVSAGTSAGQPSRRLPGPSGDDPAR
jgi:hemoglobin-like flavoprotein